MDNLAADFEINPNNPLNAEYELGEGAGFDCSFELYASGTVWGSIDGNINNQTDLINLFNTKVDITDFEELSQTVTNNYNELSGDIANLTTTVTNNYNTLSGQISDLNTTVDNNYTSLDNRLTTAEGSILDLTDTVNDNYTELNGKITTTNNNLSTLNKTVEDNNTAINNRVDGIVESFDGDISDLNNAVDNLSDTVSDNYTELNGKITVNTDNITTIQNTINSYGDIVSYNAAYFATANQGALADTALQPNDNISELINDANYITSTDLPAVDQTFNGNSANAQSGVAISGAKFIQNKSPISNSLDILASGVESENSLGLIGGFIPSSENTGHDTSHSIAIGNGSTSQYRNDIAIGQNAAVWGNRGIAIGYYAYAPANTLNIGFGFSGQYDLLDGTTGLIPDARLSSNIARISDIPTDTNDLTNGAGYITSSALGGYATQTWVTNQGYTTNVGTVTSVNNTQPDASGNVTLNIPSEVTESTVSGWGFTKNTGTVTSVNNVQPVSGNVTITIPTDTSDLTNGAGYITSSALTPYVLSSSLATVATSGSYNDLTNKPTIPSEVTESTVSGWGFTKNTGTVTSVNNTQPDASGNVTLTIPDTATWGNITGTLSNQTDLQNALDAKQNTISDLSTIRSGASLGTTALQPNDNITQLVNNAGYITSADLPTVNNGTLTIQKNGTTIGTFTANQSGNSTINIEADTVLTDDITVSQNSDDELQTIGVIDDNAQNAYNFTVVGSPTITADGIASGFSNINRIYVSNIEFLKGDNWKIYCPLPKGQTGIAGLFAIGGMCIQIVYTPENKAINYNLSSTGSTWDIANGQSFIASNLDITKEALYVLEFTGTQYKSYILQNNQIVGSATDITNSNKLYYDNTTIFILGNNRNANAPTNGSIDLKQFKITVDGVEVYRAWQPPALKYWTGTLAEYNAITTKDPNTLYNITDTGQIYKGTELIADKTKLYTTTGQNTDGAMTQKAVTDEIYYKSGDTFENTSYCVYPAYVTSSGTSVRIGITTPKRLDNITSVTCNSLIVNFRKSAGGYAPSSDWDAKANATSISCTIGASNMLYLWVNYDDYSFTNNTPVGCEIKNFSFSFT